jgi:hypothetical protein
MRDLNIFFRNAVDDLIFLLDRRYPKKQAIELVGNRYRLDGDERKILYRGVFDTRSAERRRAKLCALSQVERILIDGYNVLITLESYLKGKMVFRSMDGYVRDIAGQYGDYTFDDFTKRSVDLLVQFMKAEFLKSSKTFTGGELYLDYPVSKSGELAAYLRRKCEKAHLQIEVSVVRSPDFLIIEGGAKKGTAAASSDTVIIDKVSLVFDVPAFIIGEVFGKEVFDLIRLSAQECKNGTNGED